MPARLVAVAVGVAVIASAVLAFLLPSHEVVAGTNRVEPAHGSLILPHEKVKCQRLPSVPRGANRLRIGIAGTFGAPVSNLSAEIKHKGERVSGGTVVQVETGTAIVPLDRATTPATRRAKICFSHHGEGFVSLKGELRKVTDRQGRLVRRPVAGVLFLAPGASSWLSRMGELARRYGYGQAGALGPWTLSMVALFVLAALLFALASLLDSGERQALRREWRKLTTTELEAVRSRERDRETWEREEQRRQERRIRQLQESRWKEREDLRRRQLEEWRRQEWDQ